MLKIVGKSCGLIQGLHTPVFFITKVVFVDLEKLNAALTSSGSLTSICNRPIYMIRTRPNQNSHNSLIRYQVRIWSVEHAPN